VAQEIARAEAAMAVLGEGRMVRHFARQAEPAEPTIGEVQMDLLAQSTFRADAVAIADDQHPDQQFRVDRRPSGCAVERRQVRPDIAKVDEVIDRSQHMVDGHMLLERKLVKQSTLIDLPLAHHHLHSALITGVNHYNDPAATSEFFNRIGPEAVISYQRC
jgi:hypothetical protein